jgi:hypothetical protein
MVVAVQPQTIVRHTPSINWVKLPDDFVLDDAPVDNTGQPLIAAALRESLDLTGRLPAQGLVATNFGLCVELEGKLTLKAPDWLYVAQVNEPGIERRSYTPNLEGEGPLLVMEFLSETEGGEYSNRRLPPVGKWYFYEQILQVPIYIIFEPNAGLLEVYRLQNGRYELEQPDVEGRHWVAELGLYLSAWRGCKADRTSYWLRWWDETGTILPWAIERLDQEKHRADQAQQRSDRLAELLRAQGIDPDTV